MADPTYETITWQLAMAFGQGAGTMLATTDGVSAAIAPFAETFRGNLGNWDEQWSLKCIEYARALGAVAAVNAAVGNEMVIQKTHVDKALTSLKNNKHFPLGPCNCFPKDLRGLIGQ